MCTDQCTCTLRAISNHHNESITISIINCVESVTAEMPLMIYQSSPPASVRNLGVNTT